MLNLAIFLLTGAFFVISPHAGMAASSKAHETTPVTARLVTVQDGVAQNAGTITGGLDVRLSTGWKTYWRTPGEVGMPPQVDWSGSENVEDVEFQWPAPERFTAFGIQNFGYHGDVLFPLQITLNVPGKAARLKADVSLLVCSEICVPENFYLELDLPEGDGIDLVSADAIARSVARLPDDTGDSTSSAVSHVDSAAGRMTFAVRTAEPFTFPDVFPEAGDGVALGAPDIRVGDNGHVLWARFPILSSGPIETPSITVTDGQARAFTVQTEAVDQAPAPPFGSAPRTTDLGMLVGIAALAFLGGLILNVMPCVLPVLAIKLSSVLKNMTDTRHVRRGFLAAAGGVVTFMWVLAAVLYGLKWTGMSVGWGVQFQNPFFLAILIVIMTAFTANLFGAFEISLPSGLQTRLARSGRTGNLTGDFSTGMFAAVMATPCSAPLLGTAVAFALAGNALDIAVIFSSLGLGLASPYLIVAARPGLVTRLPRPGRWMLHVKAGLGVLLMATVAWLVWVMIGVAGQRAAVAALGFALVATAILSLSRLQWAPRFAGSAVFAGLAVFAVSLFEAAPPVSAPGKEKLAWAPFDRAKIARFVSTGDVVFVDVTADWCLTCKANKSLVLEKEPVRSAFARNDVVLMQADWTRPDDAISRYLERHGRFGIPFNAVYGPAAPEGIVLSEILTTDTIIDALERASHQD
jgi:suppressor for copper-sensitivity B